MFQGALRLRAPCAGEAGVRMEMKVASSIRDSASKLIRLVNTRLKVVLYQEPKDDNTAYKTLLPEQLRELRAR